MDAVEAVDGGASGLNRFFISEPFLTMEIGDYGKVLDESLNRFFISEPFLTLNLAKTADTAREVSIASSSASPF